MLSFILGVIVGAAAMKYGPGLYAAWKVAKNPPDEPGNTDGSGQQ